MSSAFSFGRDRWMRPRRPSISSGPRIRNSAAGAEAARVVAVLGQAERTAALAPGMIQRIEGLRSVDGFTGHLFRFDDPFVLDSRECERLPHGVDGSALE